MLLGGENFATATFAKSSGEGFQYWNEICPEESVWTPINPRKIGLIKCSDLVIFTEEPIVEEE